MPKQKTTIQTSKTLIMTILALFAVAAIAVWPAPHMRERTVSVRGECIAKVEKDRTAATLRIHTLSPDAGRSLRRAQTTYAEVTEFMRTIVDDSLELQTARFDSNERIRWDHQTQQEVHQGFETTIELAISSERREVIEDILARFSGTENVFPRGLSMYSSNKTLAPAIENCLKDAVRDAREKADAIARAGGARVGRMITAEFARHASPRGFQPAMRAMALGGGPVMMEDSGSVELFSTDTEISVTVSAMFGLK